MSGIIKPYFGAQLNRGHPLAAGLVGCWLFNEMAGNRAWDASGCENHGTLINMFDPPIATSGWGPGPHGGALAFDGSNDYLQIPDSGILEMGGNDFTIALWVFLKSTVRQAFFHWSNTADWSFGLDFSSFGESQKLGLWASSTGINWDMINSDPGGNGIGATVLPQNTLILIIVKREGNAWKVYRNNVIDINITASGAVINKAYPKIIGKWFHTNQFPLNGFVDTFYYYSRVLSAVEIAYLYAFPYCMFEEEAYPAWMAPNNIPIFENYYRQMRAA